MKELLKNARKQLEVYKDLEVPNFALYRNEADAKETFRILDSPLAFLDCTQEQQEQLVSWCMQFDKVKSYPLNRTSYGLKHDFENSPNGFGIANGVIKGAFILAGFTPRDTNDLNWDFNISKKSFNKVAEANNFARRP